MSELFLKIVNMSISASWLVLAVLLLRLVLKKAPKWVSVLLWGFVAVRLICPYTFESVLSLIPSAETIRPEIMLDSSPEIHTGIGVLNDAINATVTPAFTPNPGDSANPLQIWIPVAAVIWIAGMVGMLVYTAVSYYLLRRRVSTAVLLQNNIFQSENVASPFVLGIIKPKIYLPFQMDSKNLEYVIAHEEAHICRKDHWWKPFGFLLLALHWFNPLMWLGYILLCRDIELACDEKVIGEMDSEGKADYSQALVACSVSHRSIAACPLAFGEVGVKARVKSVLCYKKPAFWIIVAAAVACAAVAVCFLTDPKETQPDTIVISDIYARSGENTVPLISLSKGTAIGEYAEYIHYLTIDPGEEFVPFTVWKDGEEIRGTYNAFDAETFMPVEYHIPSGLDPQTYLFQNADPTREYIVLAVFSTEPDSEIYAFGAKFNSSVASVGGADDTAVEYRFTATVLQVNETYLLVEPAEGSRERSSADKIEISFKEDHSWPVPQEGDVVTVFYNGELQETYPARITQVYRVEINDSVETVKGNFRTYYKNADGTWQYDGRTYQYRLEITGRMHNAATESTFVFLSNIPSISFERAWKAAGYSSNTQDYFEPEEAVLVEIFTGNLSISAYDMNDRLQTKPETKLDAAISEAIRDQTKTDKPDGFFHTQSHIVLASEAASGTPKDGQTEHIQEETVFVYYLTMQFRIQEAQPLEQNRIYGQAIISFEVDEEGNYTLKKFLRPQYSADYDEDMKRFVPASEEAAKNEEVYNRQLLESCREMAEDYLNHLNAQASAQPGGV